MNILNYPLNYAKLFWAIALILSIYQGVRGVYVQNEKHYKNRDDQSFKDKMWKGHFMIDYYIHDFIFNFMCTLAGFTALYVECYMFTSIKDLAQIGSGTGIVISFLSLIAIAGISGVLPPILYHGKLK